MPRRVFLKYAVVWNKAAFIANEDFIEISPRDKKHVLPLLASLNSSFGEFMVRSVGHVYGGGVCNLNPSDLKDLPVLDVGALGSDALDRLSAAYKRFIEPGKQERRELDDAVFPLLGDSAPERAEFYSALDGLRRISTGLKEN